MYSGMYTRIHIIFQALLGTQMENSHIVSAVRYQPDFAMIKINFSVLSSFLTICSPVHKEMASGIR